MTTKQSGLAATIALRRREDFELDIELAVDPGETVALLGPNGAGKSTTVDVLAGLAPVEQGRIVLCGRTLDDSEAGLFVPPEQRRVGVVFQRYLLFEHLTVLENVAFGPRCRAGRRGRHRAEQLARKWLEVFDLVELAQRHPRALSGGQAQRVALARAMASEPELLLLDEPLAAVDIAARSRLRRTLAHHLADYEGPRLLITHDPADAFLLADRILVVENGRISQSGPPAEIQRHPATPYVAALAGTNFLTGSNHHGRLVLDKYDHDLIASDTHTSGAVLITIAPAAVALHRQRPDGSARNTWPTTVATVEPLGETTRILLGDPLPLGVDITPAATAALGLAAGKAIWVSVKATEIGVSPA